MQRGATTFVGFAVVAVTAWLVARDFKSPRGLARDPSLADGGAADAGNAAIAPSKSQGASVQPTDVGEAPLVADYTVTETRGDAGAGFALPNGAPVPPLPQDAPRQVRFGVVLVSYAGAQPSAGGGRPATRSKAEAKSLAERLRATADDDFHAAVQQGDSGSADDVGRVELGILEPAPEYVLFTLPRGHVAGPLDTPRGYWIVKRLD